MSTVVGAFIDLIHASLMVAWVAGLPLLFWHRWPRLSRVYAAYSIAFVVVNQLSFALLGECFLTTVARAFWQRSASAEVLSASREWFTVRLAERVFRLTPAHSAIKRVSEGLILLTAVGVAFHTTESRRLAHLTRGRRESRKTSNADGSRAESRTSGAPVANGVSTHGTAAGGDHG